MLKSWGRVGECVWVISLFQTGKHWSQGKQSKSEGGDVGMADRGITLEGFKQKEKVMSRLRTVSFGTSSCVKRSVELAKVRALRWQLNDYVLFELSTVTKSQTAKDPSLISGFMYFSHFNLFPWSWSSQLKRKRNTLLCSILEYFILYLKVMVILCALCYNGCTGKQRTYSVRTDTSSH